FSGCSRLGAVLGRLDKAAEESLADYGRYAGLAFQLVDDLLDFTASSEQLGKPVLSDLKEGKVTLPLIFAMQARRGSGDSHATAHRLVATVLEEKGFRSVRPDEITALVHESGAIERSRELARDYVRRSKASLDAWPDSPYRHALLVVPDFVLERES